ncbi:MAG: heme exporter protein CcmB [Bacteroidia bacterium]
MEIGLIRQSKILFLKEIKTEWRNRYAINGIMVQLVSAVFIASLCFSKIKPPTWNALFWIILLYSSVNAIARSFIQEREGRMLYLNSLVNPLAVLYSKMIFNALLSLLITAIAFVVFSIMLGSPEWPLIPYATLAFLFSIGLGFLFTVISAIAGKTRAGGVIMPMLSFPVVIPLIVIAVSAGSNLTQGLDINLLKTSGILLVIDIMIATLATILFRFLWVD